MGHALRVRPRGEGPDGADARGAPQGRSRKYRSQSYRHISGSIGVPPDTIRGWVDRARVDGGEKPGVTTAELEEIKALRKVLAEAKRANEILKTTNALFAAAERDRRMK